MLLKFGRRNYYVNKYIIIVFPVFLHQIRLSFQSSFIEQSISEKYLKLSNDLTQNSCHGKFWLATIREIELCPRK